MFSHISLTVEYIAYNYEETMNDFRSGNAYIDSENEGKIIKENISRSIPLFIPSSTELLSDYVTFVTINSGRISEVVDIGTDRDFNLKKINEKIEEYLPKGVIFLDGKSVKQAMNDLGYEQYKFSFKSLGPLGDGRIVTECFNILPEKQSDDDKKDEGSNLNNTSTDNSLKDDVLDNEKKGL